MVCGIKKTAKNTINIKAEQKAYSYLSLLITFLISNIN